MLMRTASGKSRPRALTASDSGSASLDPVLGVSESAAAGSAQDAYYGARMAVQAEPSRLLDEASAFAAMAADAMEFALGIDHLDADSLAHYFAGLAEPASARDAPVPVAGRLSRIIEAAAAREAQGVLDVSGFRPGNRDAWRVEYRRRVWFVNGR